jgi:hypothetical protein
MSPLPKLNRHLAVAAIAAAAATMPGTSYAGEELRIMFVCPEGDCADAFEQDVAAYLGCKSILSNEAGSAPVQLPVELHGRSDVVVSYARTVSAVKMSELIKYADTYRVASLQPTSVAETSECIRVDKYDDGKIAGLVSLFQIGQFKALTPASKSCLEAMKANLPKTDFWCARLRASGAD